ncbi:MAG: ATP-binding cassette domain-containing protein [Boseongicola sp. SB0662_bin_57]|nr:ATP-binding cassette domain-containing protein [Boseongicola sp. SB0662_bin_57]
MTLSIRDLKIETATRDVVNGVSLDVPEGQIIALLGPNGAGKSELVLGVAGVMPSTGKVSIGETDLSAANAQTVRAAGVAAVPEGHQTLAGLSVRDNLRAAGPHLDDTELAEQMDYALEVFPELKALLDRRTGTLSGGQQQMAAIAQALVSRPRILLIDEMSLGLAPVVIERLIEVVQKLRADGLGILLIEQFTQLALGIADRCHVISQGRLQFSGEPNDLRQDKGLLERAYLG